MRFNDLEIKNADNGCIIFLKVQPGAKQSKITGLHDSMLKISVTSAPEKGKANEAVVKLLSSSLGIPASEIEIVKGMTGRKKTALIRSISPEKLRDLLNALPD